MFNTVCNVLDVIDAEVEDQLHKLDEREFLPRKNTVSTYVLVLLSRGAPPDEEVCRLGGGAGDKVHGSSAVCACHRCSEDVFLEEEVSGMLF